MVLKCDVFDWSSIRYNVPGTAPRTARAMISVKRPSVSSHPSAHHHHHQTQHHYQHKQHHQLHSLQNGATSASSVTSAPLVTTTSANNNRIIRSRNQLSSGSEQQQEGKHQHPNHWNPHSGGFVSNGGTGIRTFGSVGSGQANRPTGAASWTGTGSGCSIITNGGSLYYSSSNGGYAVSTGSVNPKTRDIYEFDSLFLLPACALTSDKALNLRKDLAAYDFNIKILEDSPRTSHNVWQSGNRDATVQKQSRPASANRELQKEREERIKQMKERQNEERQKKLEELKAQALAAQKFREQKEEERRRRMDDLRRRESDRRSQVEERRRAIIEADNERREYILRKNQEREQRMETKRRNDRGSIQFAFGSSTPRMIDTSDSGMCSSFWAHRRATSITNVAYTGAALTRRSSERELTDSASKKRATSASGLDRSTDGLRSGEMTPTSLNTSRPGSAMSSSTTASGIVYRRTLPAQRKPRPASIAVTGVTASGLKEDKPPLPKTGSGASTGSGVTSASSKHRLSSAGSGSIHTTPAKSSSGIETPTKKSMTLHSAEKRSTSIRGATPKASSTPLQSPGPEKASRSLQDSLKKAADVSKKGQSTNEKSMAKASAPKDDAIVVEATQDTPLVVPNLDEQSAVAEKFASHDESTLQTSLVEVDQSFGQEEQLQQQQEEVVVPVQQEASALVQMEGVELSQQVDAVTEPTSLAEQAEMEQQEISVVKMETTMMPAEETTEIVNGSNLTIDGAGITADAMTASMIAKRITTEEEAKAALAERRRLAREEAERQAELERKRIEAEEQAERQRIFEEEERLRKLEEETIRLAEEQRRMEEERLQQAIEEARRRDEEERKRREEEIRQKAEREEAERKAREEAERQRVEMAERLKKEEKEREERRKRVEAIMSRTRAKGAAGNTPTKNNEDDKENAMSKSQIVLSSTPAALSTGTAMSASTISMTDSFIASEIRQEQQQQQAQQHQSLEQTMESLSLSNNNNNSGSSSNSSTSSETLAHSSAINSINNNNNSTNGDNIQFEKPVTEKEDLLLNSSMGATVVANNNLNNGSIANNGTVNDTTTDSEGTNNGTKGESLVLTTNGKTEQQSSAMMATSNGSNATANSTSDLIIEDALMGQTNGHKNGTMDNVLLVALVNE